MRRQLALLAYALGGLRRRGGKSAALVLGLTLVVALFASVLLLTDALRREYELGAERMPDLTVQHLIAGRPALIDAAFVERVRTIPAVRRAQPRVWGYYYFLAVEANVTIVGIDDASALAGARWVDGRLPRQDEEVALGAGIADVLGLRVGDELGIPLAHEVAFSRVVGIFDEESAIRTADLIVTPTANARRLLGVPEGMATDLAVELTTMDEAGVATERIAERVDGARVLDRRLLERTYELTFDARGGFVGVLLLPALAAFLLLAWERLSGLSADEAREIGVLKSVGWSTADVLTTRLWESALIATSASVLGVAVAYVYVFFLGAPGLWDALLGWSALHPPMRLAPALDAVQLTALIGAVVVPFVSVSVVPAWRAAMVDPERALRGGA
ncbi:MAG: ABC transporter permease [Sandaracinaceae bacterium]